MSESIGAFEAKTHFSKLLERVKAGEEIIITKHGQPVARLVPAAQDQSVEFRKEVVRRMRELAKGNRLRGLKVRDLKAEGRR